MPPYVFNNLCTCGAAARAYGEHDPEKVCKAVDCTDSYPHDGDPCPTCSASSTAPSSGPVAQDPGRVADGGRLPGTYIHLNFRGA